MSFTAAASADVAAATAKLRDYSRSALTAADFLLTESSTGADELDL